MKMFSLKGLVLSLLVGGVAVTCLAFDSNKHTTMPGDLQVDDLKLNTDNIVGSDGTARITTSSSTPNVTLTGTTSISGAVTMSGDAVKGSDSTTRITFSATAPNVILAGRVRFAIEASTGPRTNLTATTTGQLVINTTDNELCFATGTTAQTQWIRVSTTGANVPCLH